MKFNILFLLLFSFLGMSLSAKESYVVFDAVSGKVFYANDTETKRPVASLTKVAMAKLVFDWASITKTSLSTKIVVPATATQVGGSNPLELQAGDQITLRDALYASLLGSDNTSAHSLAAYVGYAIKTKRGFEGDDVTIFVNEMNKLAAFVGMNKTTFVNPHGLDNANKKGLSTVTDMAKLSLFAIQDQGLAFMVKQKERQVSVIRANGKTQNFKVKNTNKLLGKLNIKGLKTGLTASAGECLITVATKKPIVTELPDGKKSIRNRKLIVVLLGSNDRFKKTEALITDGWAAYDTWAKEGFLVSTDGKGLLKLPQKNAAKSYEPN